MTGTPQQMALKINDSIRKTSTEKKAEIPAQLDLFEKPWSSTVH
jgi:hypothetical protein